jgi:hypothetical protein
MRMRNIRTVSALFRVLCGADAGGVVAGGVSVACGVSSTIQTPVWMKQGRELLLHAVLGPAN